MQQVRCVCVYIKVYVEGYAAFKSTSLLYKQATVQERAFS
jgi:hypothetical protein